VVSKTGNSTMMTKIHLIDPGVSDGYPGLVKEIVRENVEAFDLVEYTNQYNSHGYYVFDGMVKDDIVYRLVIRVARIAEKKEQKNGQDSQATTTEGTSGR
jgi:hypothetical protein